VDGGRVDVGGGERVRDIGAAVRFSLCSSGNGTSRSTIPDARARKLKSLSV
jgi:hypothetical protein